MNKTILISGGHITPAVSVIEELKRRGEYDFVFVGREYVFSEAKNKQSFESETIQDLSIPFHDVNAPRLPQKISLSLFVFPFRFIASVFKARAIIRSTNASIVLSFGGYIGASVIVAAWTLAIPVVLHEQTVAPGRANRLLSRISTRICISWGSSRHMFAKNLQNKIILTGNPVRTSIRKAAIVDKNKIKTKPDTLYITGGGSGAHRINIAVAEILPELLSRFNVIHQCGDSHYHDYEALIARKNSLSHLLQKKYEVFKYIKNNNITSVMERADILVGRSGANTIVEISILAKPAVLIPLPESAYAEQQKHAEMLVQAGSSVMVDQETLTQQSLLNAINTIELSYQKYQENAQKHSQTKPIKYHTAAHTRVCDVIHTIVHSSSRVVHKKV